MYDFLSHKNCLALIHQHGELDAQSTKTHALSVFLIACASLEIPLVHARSTEVAVGGLTQLMQDLKHLATTQDRRHLLVAGRFYEHELAVSSLIALAEGFDVFVLTDIAIPKVKELYRATELRLTQAGIVPTSFPQLLYQWHRTETDTAIVKKIESIRAILDADNGLPIDAAINKIN